MGVNKVVYGGNTLIDLSTDTLTMPEQLLKGVVAHARDGSVVTGILEQISGGGVKYANGSFTLSQDTEEHSFDLSHIGFIPDMVFIYLDETDFTYSGRPSKAWLIMQNTPVISYIGLKYRGAQGTYSQNDGDPGSDYINTSHPVTVYISNTGTGDIIAGTYQWHAYRLWK